MDYLKILKLDNIPTTKERINALYNIIEKVVDKSIARFKLLHGIYTSKNKTSHKYVHICTNTQKDLLYIYNKNKTLKTLNKLIRSSGIEIKAGTIDDFLHSTDSAPKFITLKVKHLYLKYNEVYIIKDSIDKNMYYIATEKDLRSNCIRNMLYNVTLLSYFKLILKKANDSTIEKEILKHQIVPYKNTTKKPLQKILTSILNKYIPSDLEAIHNINLNKYNQPLDSTEIIKIVSGNEIPYYYNASKYYALTGTLGKSCMRKFGCSKDLNFYCKNPKVVKLAVLLDKETDKVKARCLVWNNIITGFKFMDRLYFCNITAKMKLANALKELGYKNIRGDNIYETSLEVYNKTDEAWVQLQETSSLAYPYFDTMTYSDIVRNRLYAYKDKNTICHTDTIHQYNKYVISKKIYKQNYILNNKILINNNIYHKAEIFYPVFGTTLIENQFKHCKHNLYHVDDLCLDTVSKSILPIKEIDNMPTDKITKVNEGVFINLIRNVYYKSNLSSVDNNIEIYKLGEYKFENKPIYIISNTSIHDVIGYIIRIITETNSNLTSAIYSNDIFKFNNGIFNYGIKYFNGYIDNCLKATSFSIQCVNLLHNDYIIKTISDDTIINNAFNSIVANIYIKNMSINYEDKAILLGNSKIDSLTFFKFIIYNLLFNSTNIYYRLMYTSTNTLSEEAKNIKI